jgi:hypothetical protein
VVFLILGFSVALRSPTALFIAIGLFALDGILLGTALLCYNSVDARGLGLVGRCFLVLEMMIGVNALWELKQQSPSDG